VHYKGPESDHLCNGVLGMEMTEPVRASGKRIMPIHVKVQMTTEAHCPSFVHRVPEVSL
jgi:hypothetical protein